MTTQMMPNLTRFGRQQSPKALAVAIILSLYVATQLPALSPGARAGLAAQFAFSADALPTLPGPQHTIRDVNPSLRNIAAWISAVGAAVALNDIDGDGLANDVCYVDTRVNHAIVAPVPGATPRYAPFALNASPLGYDQRMMAPMGCLPGDLNEDGALDLVVYYWGRTPVAFLRTGGATPQDSSYTRQELVPEGGRWFTNAAALSDVDGDGHADLLIGNYFPDGAHVLDASSTDQEAMQDSMSRAYNGGKKHFLLWQSASSGDAAAVRYRDAPLGLDDQVLQGWTLGLGAQDLDGDLLPEIYMANDFGPDRLLLNQSRPGELHFSLLEGQKGFTTPGSKVLGHDSFKSMGVDFGDLNADGRTDIYVSNITSEFALEESNGAYLSTGAPLAGGVAPFADASEPLGLSRSGWAWEARLDDFNNDGVPEALQATGFVKGQINRWPELHELAMGNDTLVQHPLDWFNAQPNDDLAGHQSNPFFARAADGRYYDIAPDLKIDTTEVSRGIATADVDGDGDLDFAVANQWDQSIFYRNTQAGANASLSLRLLLPTHAAAGHATVVQDGHQPQQGYAAVGAQATVTLPDGRTLRSQVDGGNGHSGKRSQDLHFGLGALAAGQQVQVEIRWRDAAGAIHQQQLQIAPGWHTVMLGA